MPSPKSLRLTAIGADGVAKIFLVMGRVEDISHLNSVFKRRIEQAKERPDEAETVTATESEVEAAAAADEPEIKKSAISPE